MARSKKSRGGPDVGRMLEQLAAQEEEFLGREFLAPALPGGAVRVRIGGVACRIRIEPANFTGWGIFQPVSHTQAKLVGPASLAQRREYLALLPMVRLILCRRHGETWYGSSASFGDRRIQLEGLAPVALAEEVQLFETVCTRYDGARFWFDEVDPRHDPAASTYLRKALDEQTEPDELQRPGLTAEQRAAYEVHYWQLVQPARSSRGRFGGANDGERNDGGSCAVPGEADAGRARLRASLSHAGAQMVGYLERSDSFCVRYMVGGRQYTSSVNKEDLTVQVAGICLAGQDRKFDLASMVGILREGDRHGEIVRIGDEGMAEDDYWRVHPPQD